MSPTCYTKNKNAISIVCDGWHDANGDMSNSELRQGDFARLYRVLRVWFLSVITAFTVPSWIWRERLKEDATFMAYWYLGFVAATLASVAWVEREIRKSGVNRKEFGIYLRSRPLSKIVMLVMIGVVLKGIYSALK
jgi:hypothetical protein